MRETEILGAPVIPPSEAVRHVSQELAELGQELTDCLEAREIIDRRVHDALARIRVLTARAKEITRRAREVS